MIKVLLKTMLVIGLGMFALVGLSRQCSTGSTSQPAKLNAAVRFTGSQFMVTNIDTSDWSDVELEVNGDYTLDAGRIEAGNTYTAKALQFAKDDGTRLNPFAVKPLRFKIRARMRGQQGYYSGGWK